MSEPSRAGAVYETAECRAMRLAGCEPDHVLRWQASIESPRWTYRHGDNPEALLVMEHGLLERGSDSEVAQRLTEWIRRVHAYESTGEVTD